MTIFLEIGLLLINLSEACFYKFNLPGEVCISRRIRGMQSFSVTIRGENLTVNFSRLDDPSYRDQLVQEIKRIFLNNPPSPKINYIFDKNNPHYQRVASFLEIAGSSLLSSRDKFFLSLASFPERFFELLKNPTIKNILISNPALAPPLSRPDIQEVLLGYLGLPTQIEFPEIIPAWVYYLSPGFSTEIMDELIYFSLFVDSAQLRSQKGNPEGLLRYLGTILFNFKLISKNTPLLSRAFKGLASTPGIEKTFIRLKDTTNGALRESMANEIIQIWEYLLTGDLSKINPGFPSIIISSPKDLNAKILYKNTNGEEIGAEIDVLFLTSTGETLAVEYKLYTRLEHKKTALELIQKYLELKVSQKQNPNHKVKIKLSDGKEEEINLDSVYFDLSFNPTDLSRFSWEDLKTALISLLNDPSQITDERERKRLERLLSLYGAISIDSFADDFIAWLRTRTALKNNLPEIFQYQILPSTQQIFDFNSAQSQEIRTIKREIPCSREYNFPRALLLVAAYLQRNPPPAPPVVVSLHNIKEEFGDLYHIKSILQLLEGSDPASFYQKPLSQQIAAFLKEINSP